MEVVLWKTNITGDVLLDDETEQGPPEIEKFRTVSNG
jgi:hypothetical protein